MAKWDQLIAARENEHLSQAEAAERVNVDLATYQRWELGKRRPQPQNMRSLYEIFGILLKYEETQKDIQKQSCETPLAGGFVVEDTAEIHELQAALATDMISRLWSLALMKHPTCSEKYFIIQQAIKEFDSMNTENKNYHITRRGVLRSLATLPLTTLGLAIPGTTIQAAQYGSVLEHCAASLEPCWELRSSSDANDLALAFRCASNYLSVLQTIMQDSSTYRAEALDLATRYAIVKTRLGWHCVGPAETIPYAKEAVELSRKTGDISLQLSACSKLAWTYFYLKRDRLAFNTMQETEALLTHYTHSPNAQPLHPSILGGTYSTLALVQAKNGQAPDIALGKALETNPDESYAFMTSTRSQLLMEASLTYCYAGNQVQAMKFLEMQVDPETLMPRLAQMPTTRVEAIDTMALSSLKTKDRDIEKVIHFWTAGIEGAKALKSEERFNESIANYELMAVVWPDEPRIVNLRDYLVHWQE